MEGEEDNSSSPMFFSDVVYKWLETALDEGISERDFWEMSLAELRRAIASKQRVYKAQMQEKASMDYMLAELIGRSVARIYNSNNKMPEISEAYPSLFSSKEIEEKKAEQQAEISALRFKQFAASYNQKFKEVANK